MRRIAALVCALVAAASLVALPATARRSTVRVIGGRGTAVPSFVTGIAQGLRRGRAAEVALDHLARHRGRYGIAEPHRTLVLRAVVTDGPGRTLRFGQRHDGLRVWGAEYVVHLEEAAGAYAVRSTNGHIFSDLDLTTTPRFGPAAAADVARARLPFVTRARLEPRGLVVLPFGEGVLAYHFTVSGTKFGHPVKQEVFINARTGGIALTFNGLLQDGPVQGSGVTAHGDLVPLNVFQRGSIFEMRDRSRPMWPVARGEIRTHDARGTGDYLATAAPIVTSPTSRFDGEDTASGAVDAHYGAGRVYEYYRALGRNSIDDRGMSIVSTVNARTRRGRPLFNAFWNGRQMIYGNPDPAEIYPLSAALDVVGHELTHGVTQFSAGLVPFGQPGAMNEGYSDYFGNAIDVDEAGTPMSDPQAGYIGEDLCRVPEPRRWTCPLRDLNDNSTTADYIYALVDFDSGGIHLNSTIFAGALWDIRESLGARADTYVYRALTAYATPLDDFVDGRNAVLAAASELGASASDIAAIERAFDSKGIVPGWDSAGGNDARILMRNVVPLGGGVMSRPQMSGSRFVIADRRDKDNLCCVPLQVVVGDLSGRVRLVSWRADRTYDDETPDISGSRVVWAHTKVTRSGFDSDIHSRRLGRRIKNVVAARGNQSNPAVSGSVVAWEDRRSGNFDIWARRGARVPAKVFGGRGMQGLPDVSGDWVAWWDVRGGARMSIGLENLRTGRTFRIRGPDGSVLGPPALGPRHVYWYQDTDGDGIGGIRRATFRGTNKRQVVREDPNSPTTPVWIGLTDDPPRISTNRDYITYSDEFGYAVEFVVDPSYPNDQVGRDVWIAPAAGGSAQRVTGNRGDQAFPGIGSGRRVVWLDGSQARTDLMTRLVP